MYCPKWPVTAQALQEIWGKNDWRWVFKRFQKQTLTTLTWRSAAECSTVGQQRPEKLNRRWLKDGCIGRQAMMPMQSGYTDGASTADDWWNSCTKTRSTFWVHPELASCPLRFFLHLYCACAVCIMVARQRTFHILCNSIPPTRPSLGIPFV